MHAPWLWIPFGATLLMGAPSVSPPSFTSPVGPTTFVVPPKGSAEYADYLLMLESSAFLKDKEGQVPYDPEWRAVAAGRRVVPATTAEFAAGASDLTALAKHVLAAIAARDTETLHALGVDEREFQHICWPPLPQARPYAAVPWQEAWGFQQALAATSVKHIVEEYGGTPWQLVRLQTGTSFDYGLYVLHSGLVIHVRDRDSGRRETFRFLPTAVERHGRFKVMTYDLD